MKTSKPRAAKIPFLSKTDKNVDLGILHAFPKGELGRREGKCARAFQSVQEAYASLRS